MTPERERERERERESAKLSMLKSLIVGGGL